MSRQLSSTFISDLQNGLLRELLEYVRRDDTLDIEIRNNYINIYYRGGNALKVSETGTGKYTYHFENRYLGEVPFIPGKTIDSLKSQSDWYEYFPRVKQAMDFYFNAHPKEEREYQQLVVRENNYSGIANSTDYFIVDIEYDNHKNARFDIVAIEWESEATSRKLQKGYKPRLVVIEMKYGDGALKGSAGLQKHIDDFDQFIVSNPDIISFKEEMLEVFRQKRQLGLIPCLSGTKNSNDIIQFAEDIEMMFLLAGHDPESSILQSELKSLNNKRTKFITSNYTGYGLYKENVFEGVQFSMRFKNQI